MPRSLRPAVAVCGLLVLFLSGSCQGQDPPRQPVLTEIVSLHREVILLVEGIDQLEEESRETRLLAARMAYYRKGELLENLAASLHSGLEAEAEDITGGLPRLQALLDDLFSPALHDADRLAFRELLDDLLASPAATGREDIRDDLQTAAAELSAILAAYEEEMRRVFAALRSRGRETPREQWGEYLDFLHSFLDPEEIVRRYDLPGIGRLRGSWRGLLTGSGLPPRTVVLTFDDGPHPRYTARILDILAEYEAPACFFVLGKLLGTVEHNGGVELSARADLARRALANGHRLANHSFSHPQLTRISAEERLDEFRRTDRLLGELAEPRREFMRPPYGAVNEAVVGQLRDMGLEPILWNVDSRDWSDPVPSSIARTVLTQLEEWGHGILLFHDVHKQTVEALPAILEGLRENGYRIVSIEAVLGEEEESGRERPSQE